jgi:hypothetical protein
MRHLLILETIISLLLFSAAHGGEECGKEHEAKEQVVRGLKETSSPQDLIVGSNTIVSEKEPFCRYNIYATWKGLDYDGKEQYYMQHFELDNNFIVLNAPWLIDAVKIQD